MFKYLICVILFLAFVPTGRRKGTGATYPSAEASAVADENP
jgi:hypothetical protein